MVDRNRLLAAIGLRIAEIDEATGLILRLEKAPPVIFPPAAASVASSKNSSNANQEGNDDGEGQQQPMDLESSSSSASSDELISSSSSSPYSGEPSPASKPLLDEIPLNSINQDNDGGSDEINKGLIERIGLGDTKCAIEDQTGSDATPQSFSPRRATQTPESSIATSLHSANSMSVELS